MSETILAVGSRIRGRWAGATAALAAGGLALLLLFHTEAAAALEVWTQSTAFGHCFLVAPIALFLAWERRDRLAALSPLPWPAATALMLPCGLLWLAAERLGLMEGRQLAALGMVWTLALAVLGWRVARAMAVPLAYLVFLVPFGAFLVPALQGFTAGFIDVGLTLLDIPHVVTATLIEIPEAAFRVAEACAGLRFLIAAIAFGALYASVVYRSPWRRLAFLAVSCVVPVIANGMRALGIVLYGHVAGGAAAEALDHVLYGWIFFSLVIVLMLLAGLPFREDVTDAAAQPAMPREAARVRGGMLLTTALATVLAAAGPAVAAWARSRALADDVIAAPAASVVAAGLRPGQGCVAADAPAPATRRFDCGDVRLEVHVQVFGQSAGAEVLGALRDALDAPEDSERSVLVTNAARWDMVAMPGPGRMQAAALWLDGAPAPDGMDLRLAVARHGLPPATGSLPVLVTVVATGDAAAVPEVLAGFLRGQLLVLPQEKAKGAAP